MLTLLFFCLTLLHFKQGAQVVIEDYVHDDRANKVIIAVKRNSFLDYKWLHCSCDGQNYVFDIVGVKNGIV